jgi:hypothetical protein
MDDACGTLDVGRNDRDWIRVYVSRTKRVPLCQLG